MLRLESQNDLHIKGSRNKVFISRNEPSKVCYRTPMCTFLSRCQREFSTQK